MDKEAVVHLQSGILLSHKEEWNNAICSNKDGPRDYHTEVSEVSEVKKDKYHMTSFIEWNLKKWYRWTYLPNRNRFTDLEKKHMVIKGERVGGDKLGVLDQQIHTNYI